MTKSEIRNLKPAVAVEVKRRMGRMLTLLLCVVSLMLGGSARAVAEVQKPIPPCQEEIAQLDKLDDASVDEISSGEDSAGEIALTIIIIFFLLAAIAAAASGGSSS